MKNFSISKLAEIIISRRKMLKLTQQDLADKAGINRSMLCRLENQDYYPSLDQLTRLANALEFDISDVFIEYNPPVFHHVVSRNISVLGANYVGLAVATLLARHHHVILVDDVPEKVEMINQRISPFHDEYIEKHFTKADLDLTATSDTDSACRNADYIIIAVPTDNNLKRKCFDTSSMDNLIETAINNNPNAMIVIRSTVPVGYTVSIREKFGVQNIFVSPDFSHESNALYDNLYPSRIIVGCDDANRQHAETFAGILRDAALKKEAEVLLMGLSEAEAVKLFSETCLALRVSCFNELDTYAESKGLNSRDIIQGVCLDPRIGADNSNPSFGYSGHYLPKNVNQVLENYKIVPQGMMFSIVESNRIRKEYIANRILELAGISSDSNIEDESNEKKVIIGVFRLIAKKSHDIILQNPVCDVMMQVKAKGVMVIIYEPSLKDNSTYLGNKVVNDLRKFKKQSNVIVANRYDACLDDVVSKVYTRDLFHKD